MATMMIGAGPPACLTARRFSSEPGAKKASHFKRDSSVGKSDPGPSRPKECVNVVLRLRPSTSPNSVSRATKALL